MTMRYAHISDARIADAVEPFIPRAREAAARSGLRVIRGKKAER